METTGTQKHVRRLTADLIVRTRSADVIYGFPEEPLKRMGAFLESVQSGEILVNTCIQRLMQLRQ